VRGGGVQGCNVSGKLLGDGNLYTGVIPLSDEQLGECLLRRVKSQAGVLLGDENSYTGVIPPPDELLGECLFRRVKSQAGVLLGDENSYTGVIPPPDELLLKYPSIWLPLSRL
jgi:hypothetical protein